MLVHGADFELNLRQSFSRANNGVLSMGLNYLALPRVSVTSSSHNKSSCGRPMCVNYTQTIEMEEGTKPCFPMAHKHRIMLTKSPWESV